jgi:hypothetical protein
LEGSTDEDEPKKATSLIERNTIDIMQGNDSMDKTMSGGGTRDVNRTTITVNAQDESKIEEEE